LTRNAFVALSVSLLAAASTTAATTPPSSSQATTVAPVTAKANAEEKVVCKYETPVGSRLGGRRVCMTQAEWKAQEQDSRRQRDFAPPAGISGSH
jgi:hypothetical protein